MPRARKTKPENETTPAEEVADDQSTEPGLPEEGSQHAAGPQLPGGVETTVGEPEPEPAPTPPPRGRQSSAPECPYCHIRCVAGSTRAGFTYYYCPNSMPQKNKPQTCSFSHKQARPELIKRGIRERRRNQGFSAR